MFLNFLLLGSINIILFSANPSVTTKSNANQKGPLGVTSFEALLEISRSSNYRPRLWSIGVSVQSQWMEDPTKQCNFANELYLGARCRFLGWKMTVGQRVVAGYRAGVLDGMGAGKLEGSFKSRKRIPNHLSTTLWKKSYRMNEFLPRRTGFWGESHCERRLRWRSQSSLRSTHSKVVGWTACGWRIEWVEAFAEIALNACRQITGVQITMVVGSLLSSWFPMEDICVIDCNRQRIKKTF